MSLSLYQVFANSVSTAILPALSASARAEDSESQRRDIRFGYRLLSLITWPAAALMAALSLPIVRVLFERGAFDAADTSLTAMLLAIYALNVPALALVQVLLAPLYAGRDAGTPTRHMAWMLGTNVLLAWVFMRFVGVSGLAWAATVTAALSLGRAYWLVRRLGKLGLSGYTVRVVGASCVAGVAAWAAWSALDRLSPAGSTGITLLTAIAAGALGGLLYVAVVWLLRLEELPHLRNLLRSRIG
jgi:putative peptidoglycan lipid II flippase